MSSASMAELDPRRRNVRRWTIGLVLIVLAFYFGFILIGVTRAG